jgi:sugar lactone lactonase YvrE
LNEPDSICTDSNGNLYITDTGNNIVRKITFKYTESGEQYIDTHSIVAGNMDLSTDPSIQLKAPTGICFDPNTQCIFVADSGKHVVRKIDPNGDVTIYAGKLNRAGYSGDGNLATSAQLNHPTGLYTDNNSNLFICDTYNHVIRKIDNNGIITLFAGTPQQHNTPITIDETFPTKSYLNSPSGVSGDKNGNIYIADTGNNRIRKVDINTGKISTFSTIESTPIHIAIDINNNIYVNDHDKNLHFYPNETPNEVAVGNAKPMNNLCLDMTTNSIYYITNNTVKLTSIKNSNDGISFDGNPTSIYDTNLNSNTNRNTVVLNSPQDMCIDAAGENIYIADTNNHVIRKMDSNGNISIFAGTFLTPTKVPVNSNLEKQPQTRSNYTSDPTVQNGMFRTQTTFNSPQGICCDNLGNIYIADTSNHVIRKIDSQGNVFTVAGSFNTADNTKFTFTSPTSVGVDTTGNLYVIAATYLNNDSTTQIIQINKQNDKPNIFASGTYVDFTKTKNTYNTANLMTDNVKIPFQPLKKLFISPTNDLYVTSAKFVYKITNKQVSIHKDYESTTGNLKGVFIDNKNNTYITDDILKIINTNSAKKYNVKSTQNWFDYDSVFVDGVVNIDSYGTKSTVQLTSNNTPATNAMFDTIVSCRVDKKGNIYALDAGNNVVYKIYNNTNTV